MTIQAGDIGFAHTKGLMGRLIRLGEALKGKLGSEWNHQFVVDRIVDGVPYIIQATFEGVTDTAPLSMVAPGGRYITMPPPPEVDRGKLLEFCRSEVGTKYSLLSDVAIGIDILSWNWVPALMNSYRRTWQCAGLINEGMRFGGWLHQWVNCNTVTPQMGFLALQ
ncbi:MAG TPA: hypothetical protein VG246_13180 [Acidimicrobiales bacterium]|nr:hypothetical protein [Acidimicrobiales bacterium]